MGGLLTGFNGFFDDEKMAFLFNEKLAHDFPTKTTPILGRCFQNHDFGSGH